MSNYKVSICIPVFNAEKFLEETLSSLTNQSLEEIEIICVNDGSSDSSEKIILNYMKHYKNIKLINQSNQGLGGARNTGLENANGEYIGFIDADDIAHPLMYEELYKLAKINDADIAMCNLKFYPEGSKTKKSIWFNETKGKIDGDFLNRNTQPWNKIVRKKLIDELNFKFFEKNGDGMFVIPMVMANKIVSTRKELYYYRVGHLSMSTDYKLSNFEISINSAKEQIKFIKNSSKYNEFKEYFEYRLIYSLIQGIAVAALKKDKTKFNKWKKELYELKFKRNEYCNSILKKEFGYVKFIGMIDILPKNYYLSAIISNLIL